MQKSKDAIVRRWLEDVLATYGGDCAVAFKRQKDPFANPVGHGLREGTRGIFEALIDGMDRDKMDTEKMDTEEMDTEKICKHLHQIIRIRAVQQFSASQAVGFVFGLKAAVRAELPGSAGASPSLEAELAKFESRIDRIALDAFDIFAQCREQVCELRVNEVKRRVSWVVDKMKGVGSRD